MNPDESLAQALAVWESSGVVFDHPNPLRSPDQSCAELKRLTADSTVETLAVVPLLSHQRQVVAAYAARFLLRRGYIIEPTHPLFSDNRRHITYHSAGFPIKMPLCDYLRHIVKAARSGTHF